MTGHRLPTSGEVESVLTQVFGFQRAEAGQQGNYTWLVRKDGTGRVTAMVYIPTDREERIPLRELTVIVAQAGLGWHELWNYLE